MTTPRTVTIATENEQSVLNLTPNEIFELVASMTQGSIEYPLPNPMIMLGLEKDNSDKLLADLPIITSTLKDEGVRLLYGVHVSVTIVDGDSKYIFSKCVISLRQPSNSLTLYEIPSMGYSTEKL